MVGNNTHNGIYIVSHLKFALQDTDKILYI